LPETDDPVQMKPEEIVRRFVEEWMGVGLSFALERFRQRLPFCRDVDRLGAHLLFCAEEMRKLRRVCRMIILCSLVGIAASVPILLNAGVATPLRILCCPIAAAAIVVARNFFRHLPGLKPEPLLHALECSRLYVEESGPAPE
jgi:hypothetical protein